MTQKTKAVQISDKSLNELSDLVNSWGYINTVNSSDQVNDEWTLEQKLDYLRQQKVGRLSLIPTPNFWQSIHPRIKGNHLKTLVHLDYTASAQGLEFIEHYILNCLKTYANTHTETSITGKSSTQRFHAAIETIRQHVRAGSDSFVIPCGYGATGAIERIQKILGLYLSPKGQKTLKDHSGVDLKEVMKKKFVVFVGPTEHHSNDVTWQDAALCHFVRIKAVKAGPLVNMPDLEDLEHQLQQYPDAVKIGSFSAASNVTGMTSQLPQISKLMKKHNGWLFADYAASGPYADIDMERDGLDGIFLSMHKNIGGSNLGILVGKNHLYDREVNPSFGGGGTVSAVTPWEYHFHEKIEDREYPGTPAIRQVWQAALSFQLKEWVGLEEIQKLDHSLTSRMLNFMNQHPKIKILGNPDPSLRYPIFSFLVKHGQKMLHHTFVAALLNDIFGIQARSGCACAGPFGHELLEIPRELSKKYISLILNVLNGFKPGWTRIGTHYTLSETELDYILKALNGIAYLGPLFLDQYNFNPYTGEWIHKAPPSEQFDLDIQQAISLKKDGSLLSQLASENDLYASFEQQWQQFVLLCSSTITNKLITWFPDCGLEAKFDELVIASFKTIKAFLESFQGEEQSLIDDLAKDICHIVSQGSQAPASSDCKAQLKSRLDALISTPEKMIDHYDEFKTVESDVAFFYAPKGSVHPPIGTNFEGVSSCKTCRA